MHLVDHERPVHRVVALAVLEPLAVFPLVAGLGDDARRARRQLGRPSHGIGLQRQLTGRAVDLELVVLTGRRARHEQLPHARRAEHSHRMDAAVPRVEVADDPHRPRARRPHRERGAVDALVPPRVRAERLPQAMVRCPRRRDEGRRRRGSARTGTDPPRSMSTLPGTTPRRGRRPGSLASSTTKIPASCTRVIRTRSPAAVRSEHSSCTRAPDPHDPPAIGAVRAEHVMRRAMVAGRYPRQRSRDVGSLEPPRKHRTAPG